MCGSFPEPWDVEVEGADGRCHPRGGKQTRRPRKSRHPTQRTRVPGTEVGPACPTRSRPWNAEDRPRTRQVERCLCGLGRTIQFPTAGIGGRPEPTLPRRDAAMLKPDAAVPEEQHFVLSNLSPGRTERCLALGIVLGLLIAMYLITGPLSGIRLATINAFVAVYATAMFVTDSVTAILLYAQFSILRSRGVLVIASGYLFTALIVVLYILAFPGVLAPDAPIGGLQTAAWLYVTWHTGFPLFVIGYALSKDEDPGKRFGPEKIRPAILSSVGCTAALAAAAGYATTSGMGQLPRIMLDPLRFSPDWPYLVGAPIASVCISAILVPWLRRPPLLDL